MDLNNRPRHTHRAFARFKDNSQPGQLLGCSRTAVLMRKQYKGNSVLVNPDIRTTEADEPSRLLALLADEIGGAASLLGMEAKDQQTSVKNSEAGIRTFKEKVAKLVPQPASLANTNVGFVKPLTQRRRLSRYSHPKAKQITRVESMPDGRRREIFGNGAEVSKDPLGRVVSIKSAYGERLTLQYSGAGDLISFVRTATLGKLHSFGERDRHVVVVRDELGRLMAAGESISVDPFGCLSIHNHDGQFVSVDLVRGLLIERKHILNQNGDWKAVTAVFAHDGFRLATRFHNDQWEDQQALIDHLRFYGRDGSLVEFISEEDLRGICPRKVLPPGSLHVDVSWRSSWQAGTAWEAVQEYLSIIS